MEGETLLETMSQAIIDGDVDACRDAAEKAMAATMDPALVISEGLMKGIQEVGRRFSEGEFFLPELLLGAKAMQAGIDAVNPVIKAQGGHRMVKGKVVVGVVQGDIHTIGKEILRSVFGAYGFEVVDLQFPPLRRFFAGTYLRWVMSVYHPQGFDRLSHRRSELEPKGVFITRDAILQRYGPQP
jgi:5-methyltetrahydrofolate--homocysteine methyltransferase